MASIFTAPAPIRKQGLAAMLITVECCVLVRYQVGVTYVQSAVPKNIAEHIVSLLLLLSLLLFLLV